MWIQVQAVGQTSSEDGCVKRTDFAAFPDPPPILTCTKLSILLICGRPNCHSLTAGYWFKGKSVEMATSVVSCRFSHYAMNNAGHQLR